MLDEPMKEAPMGVRIVLLLWLFAALLYASPTQAGIGDLLKTFQKEFTGQELSEAKVADGLKEALKIGSRNAVRRVSKVDGFFGNPEIRIPLPGWLQKTEDVLRTVGYGPKLDAFEMSMNRAAEKASPKAKALFWDAVRQITFSDAREILSGRIDEATRYLKEKTYDRLFEIFQPEVRDAMNQVGVTRQYQAIDQKIATIPFTESVRFDLDDYVSERTLDGLFFMLAKEEEKIRRDPAARVTDLLKEVFGSR